MSITNQNTKNVNIYLKAIRSVNAIY